MEPQSLNPFDRVSLSHKTQHNSLPCFLSPNRIWLYCSCSRRELPEYIFWQPVESPKASTSYSEPSLKSSLRITYFPPIKPE